MDGARVAALADRRATQLKRIGSATRSGPADPSRLSPGRGGRMKSKPRELTTQPVRVGYILKMFPRLSETFILNEILELERQGLGLKIFSLKLPADSVQHDQVRAVRSRI